MKLAGKHIVLGVCSSVAAYKSALVLRQLRRLGAHVQVLMTPAATRFVGSATFQALSGQPVLQESWCAAHGHGMAHIECARRADLILIAPASANTIAKLSHGIADNVLTTACLASQAPLALAAAMNQAMWSHPATCANVKKLLANGVRIWGPATGEQACGESGEGRLLEPSLLVQYVVDYFSQQSAAGQRVIITAGATQEAMDEVRYISNRSSGKMGFAMAQAAYQHGADTTLIAAPTALSACAAVRRIDVVSAEEMRQAVFACLEQQPADWFIACAAVADYRPAIAQLGKLKKTAAVINCRLIRTRDIVAEVAQSGRVKMTVGFAAETDDLVRRARAKLIEKKLDLIVANQVGHRADYGFDSDDNKVEVCWQQGSQALGPMPKTQLAQQLIKLFAHFYQQQTNNDKPATHSCQTA